MKRAPSIRTWLVGTIIGTVLTAYAGMFLLVLVTDLMKRPADDLTVDEALYRQVETVPDRWGDPAWQRSVQPALDAAHLGVRITRDTAVVYESRPVAAQTAEHRQVLVIDATGTATKVTWLVPYPFGDERWRRIQNVVIPGGAVIILVLTTVVAVSFISRPILQPLRQLSAAAGRINRGDLAFDVPSSRVREVNEFAQAFGQMREGLRESLAQQAALEQERRLFIAAMAHDLRTPLTSVRGYLEGIRDGMARTPEKLERYLAVALEKTGALERLVDGLFTYSRTEYLNQPPQMEPLSLHGLVADAVAGLQPQAAAKGVALSLDAAGPEAATVPGDRALLQRVLDNLLDNALRHTPAGGRVAVGWWLEADQARIWVQDGGPGIPPEDLGRVFAPLYRGDKARSTRTGGAGLGLAIAQRLVAAHGGNIGVENRDGARFTVTLPR